MCERPLTERARLRLPWQVARSATGARTNLRGDSIACNAMAHARRAQRPRRFPRDAPDVRSRAEAAGLTATGTTQRTPTEASGARRATGTTQARRESLIGGRSGSMRCVRFRPNVKCGSKRPARNEAIRPGLSRRLVRTVYRKIGGSSGKSRDCHAMGGRKALFRGGETARPPARPRPGADPAQALQHQDRAGLLRLD